MSLNNIINRHILFNKKEAVNTASKIKRDLTLFIKNIEEKKTISAPFNREDVFLLEKILAELALLHSLKD